MGRSGHIRSIGRRVIVLMLLLLLLKTEKT